MLSRTPSDRVMIKSLLVKRFVYNLWVNCANVGQLCTGISGYPHFSMLCLIAFHWHALEVYESGNPVQISRKRFAATMSSGIGSARNFAKPLGNPTVISKF